MGVKFSAMVACLLFALGPLARASDSLVILNGKPYELKARQIPTCGQLNSPELAAAKASVAMAFSLGESFWQAACTAGTHANCSAADVKRAGIVNVFKSMRNYESPIENVACKELRKSCEDLCVASKAVDPRDCTIECNQYETWTH